MSYRVMSRSIRALRERGLIELGPLVTLFLVAAALFGFVEIAGAVVEGENHAFDEALLRLLRNPADPIGPVRLEKAVRDLTALGSVTVLTLLMAVVLGYLYLLVDGKRAAALFVLVSVAGTGAEYAVIMPTAGRSD